VGKGTHFGIQRVKRFMRASSENFTKETWVLKLDVKGFFMGIDKEILYQQMVGDDFLLKLIHQIIFHDPTKDCIIRGSKSDRIGLPSDKSLFHCRPNTGLPIGNLTSQLFANIYLHALDHYIKYELGFRWYGRYVDDFVLFHQDKQKLLEAIPLIRSFLADQLHLTLHPKKISLQSVSHGLLFLGSVIKPYRSYLRRRTLGKRYQKIKKLNETFDHDQTLAVMNSYLGMTQHYCSYTLACIMWKQCNNRIRSAFSLASNHKKIKPLVRKLRCAELKHLIPQGYWKGSMW
jgi:hypothetical protein